MDYSKIVSVPAEKYDIDTTSLFSKPRLNHKLSPIDHFIQHGVQLNLWWSSESKVDFDSGIGIFLLLGYISAVESYCRLLIRRVVFTDQHSKTYCANRTVSYAAALHHPEELLGDALLENTVFSGKKNILDALKDFLNLNQHDKSILLLLDEYEKLCQIRHCCVHRFGRLGTRNAIVLGSKHFEYLEAPIFINRDFINTVASLTFNLVKALNNDIFRQLIARTVKDNPDLWKWNFKRDSGLFGRYYNIFASKEDATPSEKVNSIYKKFKQDFKDIRTTHKRRNEELLKKVHRI